MNKVNMQLEKHHMIIPTTLGKMIYIVIFFNDIAYLNVHAHFLFAIIKCLITVNL